MGNLALFPLGELHQSPWESIPESLLMQRLLVGLRYTAHLPEPSGAPMLLEALKANGFSRCCYWNAIDDAFSNRFPEEH